jgi:chemosensory pili system protein ChpA (sensor histidine kinase/response regulator)
MEIAEDFEMPVVHDDDSNELSGVSVQSAPAVTSKVSAKPDKKEQIRVRTDLLDTLANYAGEVSISRARMEQQIFGFRENLGELDRNVIRFRDQLRELEIQSESQMLSKVEQEGVDSIEDFDPLEFDRFSNLQQLSRSLTESLYDLASIQGSLGNFASEAETVLHQQARVNTDLQEGLMRTRLVSFSTQSTRLRHIVRQTSREVNKQAQFEIIGAEVELDRNVLERMIGPFEHMIRNSLDHGIETEEVRKKQGKPASGKIKIETTQQGSEIVILFSDDGAGLNIDAIRKKAISNGLMAADSKLSDEEITQFILMSGFSTAEKVTSISGRGVGMDVVHNEVRQLGGAMSVETEAGKGTIFVVRLPLTLSITQALMVYVGETLYATPLSGIVNILEVPNDEMAKITGTKGKEPVFEFEEKSYPFMHLGARLEVPSVPRNPNKVPVLLVKSGSRTVAIQIDGLAGTKEIVIKNVGPLVGEVRGVSGATILGDGTVVLILDVPDLWVSDDLMHVAHVKAPEAPKVEERIQPLIMVVDDSLTVRKITSRHLLKNGMECITAKDGLDALEQLRDHKPDVMLVDIEMPRMDGFELTTRIRATAELKNIPIIMITSRAGKKHKDKAFSLGVDDYMSKPYQQELLFENIERLLKEGRAL